MKCQRCGEEAPEPAEIRQSFARKVAGIERSVQEIERKLKTVFDEKNALENERTRLRAIIEESQSEKRVLEHKLNFCEKLTEQIATLEDRRVLDAAGRLPPGALGFMSSQLSRVRPLPPGLSEALDAFVSFELGRRIANADLDLPFYMNDSQIVETPHRQLFEMLEEATAAGKNAASLTPEEREARFEAYLRQHGYLKHGETLAKDDDGRDGT
jgi:hypothetical protein